MAKTVIRDVQDKKVVFVKTVDSYKTKISDSNYNVRINDTLPFRVKFINIGINAYGPNNPAPIGIAVIGLNNYIL